MRVIKAIAMMLMLILVISCKTKANSNSQSQERTQKQNEEIKLHKIIKLRTQNHIKKYGIKKVLLDNDGIWICFGEEFKFFSNGKVRIKFESSYNKIALWKVDNGKLYFNLNGLQECYDNNFYEIKVEPSIPPDSFFGYIKAAKNIKYVIIITAKIKESNSDKYYKYHKIIYHYYKTPY